MRVTLVPAEDFEGLPAGKPFRSYSAAILDFDDDGKLVRETIYGSLGQVLTCSRRMREFVAEQERGSAAADPPP